jgi:hypothetical protein
MFSKISPKLILVTILLLSVSAFAQKGKPSPCVKPTVAPPDTSSHTGSGGLDLSFNGTGFALFQQVGAIKSVFTLPGGKIVGIGEGVRTPDSPTLTDLLIIRLNADGSPDTTFGDVDPNDSNLRLV